MDPRHQVCECIKGSSSLCSTLFKCVFVCLSQVKVVGHSLPLLFSVHVTLGELLHNDKLLAACSCVSLAIKRHEPECKFERVDLFACIAGCTSTYCICASTLWYVCQAVGVWEEVNWWRASCKSVISHSRYPQRAQTWTLAPTLWRVCTRQSLF